MMYRPLLCAALLALCSATACGDDGPAATDAGDRDARGGQRDVPDATTTDTGGVDATADVIIDDGFTRPDIASDAALDAPDDVTPDAADDASEDVGFDTPPLPDVDSALALSVVEAGRDAIADYCACDRCVSNGFGSEAACRASALGGGFELNECKVGVIEDLGLQAESYLRCMKAAFDTARDCTPECSTTECLACDSAFGRAWSACQSQYPTPYASLRDCDGE